MKKQHSPRAQKDQNIFPILIKDIVEYFYPILYNLQKIYILAHIKIYSGKNRSNLMEIIKVNTSKREDLVDITSEIKKLIQKNNWKDGILFIYCPHTTAGITINESADPSVAYDITNTLIELIPRSKRYTHLEGNSDAHIKSSLVGCSEYCFVENGQLILGTWQGIFFAEFDGPRSRKVYVKFLRC
jgi:secondary thiamine-phosphate synthase enzyme